MTRDKPAEKPAPGKRKCNCRNKVVTRQLGPGMFQQFQQQECQECPNVQYERETETLTVSVEPGMRDGQVGLSARQLPTFCLGLLSACLKLSCRLPVLCVGVPSLQMFPDMGCDCMAAQGRHASHEWASQGGRALCDQLSGVCGGAWMRARKGQSMQLKGQSVISRSPQVKGQRSWLLRLCCMLAQEIVFFEEGEPLLDGEPGDLKFIVRCAFLENTLSVELIYRAVLLGLCLCTDIVGMQFMPAKHHIAGFSVCIV